MHTPMNMQTYKNTDKHMHIRILFIIQFRWCFLTLCLKIFKLLAFLIESNKLFHIEGPI